MEMGKKNGIGVRCEERERRRREKKREGEEKERDVIEKGESKRMRKQCKRGENNFFWTKFVLGEFHQNINGTSKIIRSLFSKTISLFLGTGF